ncbi:hypothetical protein ABID08_006326 [Rhizobium binae]|uniref:Transposase DDE domain-containing protein n=1 Tax=Rhizobium binae TaxID=1138190 RepID=A0ABV2MTR8_9HYPH
MDSLTLWMTPEALAGWHARRRKTRGGQPRNSDLAIETALTLGCVFGMRLRQTEGLMNSVFDLMGLEIPVPDHTTLSRRAQTWKLPAQRNPPLPDGPLHVLVDSTGLKVYGAGQWLEEKHGARSRRNWRKFHLAVDANSGEIIAHRLTDQGTDDPSQVEPLLSQIDGEIDQSPPTEPMMASQPIRRSCSTAQPRTSSFHRVRRRWKAMVIQGHLIKETST